MSWDAYLAGREWNYTHNTNPMIRRVLTVLGVECEPAWWDGTDQPPPSAWWPRLDGTTGEAGAALLDRIVGGLMEAPDLFRQMNPENGWGDYDSLLAVLVEMRDHSYAHPAARWSVSG